MYTLLAAPTYTPETSPPKSGAQLAPASRAITPTPAEITQLWGMVSHDNYESFVIAHARVALEIFPTPQPAPAIP